MCHDVSPQALTRLRDRGNLTAAQRVVIGDGAWTWNIAAEQFPGAIEIVDIYHAKQHLCDVAKVIYGPGTDLADRWARDRRAELDGGRLVRRRRGAAHPRTLMPLGSPGQCFQWPEESVRPRWQSEEMAVRWAAVTFRETEKHYRRITGYEHLWMLKAHLDEEDGVLAELQKAGNVCLSLPTFYYRRDTLPIRGERRVGSVRHRIVITHRPRQGCA